MKPADRYIIPLGTVHCHHRETLNWQIPGFGKGQRCKKQTAFFFAIILNEIKRGH